MTPSFRLLVDCCSPGAFNRPSDSLRDRLRQADGGELVRLASRHRVEGLLWRAMTVNRAMPAGASPIGEAAQRIAADALRLVTESGRLHATFARASLPHIFLKGQPSGHLAWNDVSVKRQSDLDLLVLPQSIGKAAGLLDALGYVQEIPDPSVDPVDWHRSRKESLWRSDDGVLVDLHGRVADNPRLLPHVTAGIRPEIIEVMPGVTLPALPRHILLPYLAVHGASSAWFRLKWIAEFAAIAAHVPDAELTEIVERAPRLGAGRTLSAAMALAHRLFGTPVPDAMWFDGGAQRLVAIALAQLSHPQEPTERRWGTWSIHQSQVLMVPGSHFALSEILRQGRERITR